MAEQQIDFWSNNPCGPDGSLAEVIRQRFQIDFWLSNELQSFPTDRKKYLEVGCGQGVDSLIMCTRLAEGSQYTAIDYSPESIRRATDHLEEAKQSTDIRVIPTFATGNALALDFADNEFDFVYSMGVCIKRPIRSTPSMRSTVFSQRTVRRSFSSTGAIR